MCEGTQITARDLDLDETPPAISPLNLRYVRDAAERQALLKALNYTDGNLSHAADLLGITRPTLYTLLNKYQLKA
jgi:two-component system NtrC family response regulator